MILSVCNAKAAEKGHCKLSCSFSLWCCEPSMKGQLPKCGSLVRSTICRVRWQQHHQTLCLVPAVMQNHYKLGKDRKFLTYGLPDSWQMTTLFSCSLYDWLQNASLRSEDQILETMHISHPAPCPLLCLGNTHALLSYCTSWFISINKSHWICVYTHWENLRSKEKYVRDINAWISTVRRLMWKLSLL